MGKMKCLIAVSLLAVASSSILGVGAKRFPRIVNGTEVADNAYPFQVSVQEVNDFDGFNHTCGGVIITTNYVLSAAHCNDQEEDNETFVILPASQFHVRVGSVLQASGGHLVPVADIMRHPDYTPFGNQDDIALYRLATPLTFTESVQPIALSTGPPPHGAVVTILGWGYIQTDGPSSPRMLETTSFAMSNEECRAFTDEDTDGILCLARNGITGTCDGDSGGAAIYGNTLVGLSSYRLNDSCLTTLPDMYANVAYFLDWLKENSDLL